MALAAGTAVLTDSLIRPLLDLGYPPVAVVTLALTGHAAGAVGLRAAWRTIMTDPGVVRPCPATARRAPGGGRAPRRDDDDDDGGGNAEEAAALLGCASCGAALPPLSVLWRVRRAPPLPRLRGVRRGL